MNSVLLFAGTTEGRRIAQGCRNLPVTLYVSHEQFILRRVAHVGSAAENCRRLSARFKSAFVGA